MAQTLTPALTLKDFLQLSETQPASEYINGRIFQKPMPQGKHSVLQTQLSTTINSALQSVQVAWAFSELRCTFGGRSTVPDIAVFVWERLPCDDNGEIADTFTDAPDWTIEILSPDQNQTRVTKNILHCLQHGSQMGWLIDPEEQTVLVYLPPEQVKVFDQPQQVLPAPSFAKEISVTVGDLFDWLVVRRLKT
ncbi:Uma2 family endonuclease [Acaryochloris sp. CCMEE 5410]|uniref:Uma2 family endonuclease n=1 Tax=Acaryochloris sp. CCMEE 5410 TaxID=310037 RepID=UPI00024839F0|nr:Uma2 family endonuclease [Acaryochloris sp. CCMEE 5410]KAI9134619.1 Uma2 family endonuclease [Acaryochloris sp. CCMEE 5410]